MFKESGFDVSSRVANILCIVSRLVAFVSYNLSHAIFVSIIYGQFTTSAHRARAGVFGHRHKIALDK